MSQQDTITEKLDARFELKHLEVVNESGGHNVPAGSETHFKVVLVSPQFAGLNAVKRHQKVYATLGGLMGEFHALALHTFTPEEWSQAAVPASPTCRGGSKHDIP